MKLQIGQGFFIGESDEGYNGLIVNVTEDDVEYITVKAIFDEIGYKQLSYDDPDAVYERDKDNVYLRDCPPPFTKFSLIDSKGNTVNNAYAVADMSNVNKMSRFSFDAVANIIDDGKTISERDLRTIRRHPWPKQFQKEKSYREIPYFEDNTMQVEEVHDKDNLRYLQAIAGLGSGAEETVNKPDETVNKPDETISKR